MATLTVDYHHGYHGEGSSDRTIGQRGAPVYGVSQYERRSRSFDGRINNKKYESVLARNSYASGNGHEPMNGHHAGTFDESVKDGHRTHSNNGAGFMGKNGRGDKRMQRSRSAPRPLRSRMDTDVNRNNIVQSKSHKNKLTRNSPISRSQPSIDGDSTESQEYLSSDSSYYDDHQHYDVPYRNTPPKRPSNRQGLDHQNHGPHYDTPRPYSIESASVDPVESPRSGSFDPLLYDTPRQQQSRDSRYHSDGGMSFSSEKSHLQRFLNRHSKGSVSSKKKKVRYSQDNLSSNDSSESELTNNQQIAPPLKSRNGARYSSNRYSAGYLDERTRIEIHESNVDQNDGFHTPQANRKQQQQYQKLKHDTARSRSMDGRTRMFNRKVCRYGGMENTCVGVQKINHC